MTTDDDGDVLVIFGITGDLAKVMTFHSLYRLEKRGLLHCSIVGVAADVHHDGPDKDAFMEIYRPLSQFAYARMSLVVRAPATTANLGPGFDCAAAALDLWNELHVEDAADGGPLVSVEGEGADEVPQTAEHLALRAFALVAPLEGRRFHFVNRIPLERGLGSSAAAIAMGLVAGAAVTGRVALPGELLTLGVPIEGHADNLAAALYGGVCIAMKRNGTTRQDFDSNMGMQMNARACPAKVGGDTRGAAEYIKLADGILRIVGQIPERDMTPDKLNF